MIWPSRTSILEANTFSSPVCSRPHWALEALRFPPLQAGAAIESPHDPHPTPCTPGLHDLGRALFGPQSKVGWYHGVEPLQARGCCPLPESPVAFPLQQIHTPRCLRTPLRGGASQPRGHICRLLRAQPWDPAGSRRGAEPSRRTGPQCARALCWYMADTQARARAENPNAGTPGELHFFSSWSGVMTVAN